MVLIIAVPKIEAVCTFSLPKVATSVGVTASRAHKAPFYRTPNSSLFLSFFGKFRDVGTNVHTTACSLVTHRHIAKDLAQFLLASFEYLENIIIHGSSGDVCFYTHGHGYAQRERERD